MTTDRRFDCLMTSCIHNSENHVFSWSELDVGLIHGIFLMQLEARLQKANLRFKHGRY